MRQFNVLFAVILMIGFVSCRGAVTPPMTSDDDNISFSAIVEPTLPYSEIEAEAGETSGTVSAISTVLHTAGAEASGRRYVSLEPGESLTVAAPVDADSIVVRFSFPDSTSGGGDTGSLTLKIGSGATQSVGLTSKYSWEYGTGSFGSANVWNKPPSAGSPRHFWDEVNQRVPAFSAGTHVTLTNPTASGVTLLVDLIDFEAIGPAVEAPVGAVTFSADKTGTTDVTTSLQIALNGLPSGGTLYIPEGVYRIGFVTVNDERIQGAGLWRTRFVGPNSHFHFAGGTARLADFAIFGETNTRDDTSDGSDNGLSGVPASGSMVERLWIEHKKCGYWVGVWNTSPWTNGVTLSGLRIRNTMADGINLCSGTTQSMIVNCLVRNTGDDGLAAWSPRGGGPAGGNNTFRNNVVQMPWLANGIALYGGGPFTVEGNLIVDTVTTGSGIYVSQSFGSWAFSGQVFITGNTLIRAGAHESDSGGPTGAFRISAGEGPLTDAAIRLTNNRVVAPLESVASIQGPYESGKLVFNGLWVEELGDTAMVSDVRSSARGSASFKNVTYGTTSRFVWRNASPSNFTLVHP